MKRIFVSFLILVMSVFWLQAEGKKPFSIMALYHIKNVSDPQISPDGKRIAFVVTKLCLEKSKSNSDIYVMDRDGKNIKRLTTFKGGDWHPRWNDNGKEIIFFSSREGSSQLWKINPDGGEAIRLTSLECNGINEPLITPDGKKMIFYTSVFPEYGEDLAATEADEKAMREGPVRAHYAKKLLFRHWTEYRDGKYNHTMVMDIKSGEIKDLTPGEIDFPMFSLGGPTVALSPDGSEVCVVANPDSIPAVSTNGDLFLINIESGEMKNVTKRFRSFDVEPVYSPDGNYIAFKHQTIPGYEADRNRLAVYNRKTGEIKILTEQYNNDVASMVWSPDSRYIYFTGEEKGNTPVYKIDVRNGKMKQLISIKDAKYISSLRITPDGKELIFVRRSIEHPAEIYSVKTSGKKMHKLTYFNKNIEEKYDIRPAEEMWIEGADGAKVHTYVIKPYNFDPDKKYPLIINVHGGPQMMWADAFRGDWQIYPGSGYVLAFFNPHGSKGYGQEYCAAISKDWGGKIYEDVLKVTEYLSKLPYVDEERMGAMGWSYGGYMMMWLQGHDNPFKAFVAMMGVYDLRAMYSSTEELWFPEWDLDGTPWDNKESYLKWSPSEYVKNFKTPTLVITGEKDYRVPYTQSLEYFTDLQKMGVPSELIVFKNDGHWPSYLKSMPLYYNAHLYWFHKYLGGDKEPYDMDKMVRNRIFEK